MRISSALFRIKRSTLFSRKNVSFVLKRCTIRFGDYICVFVCAYQCNFVYSKLCYMGRPQYVILQRDDVRRIGYGMGTLV